MKTVTRQIKVFQCETCGSEYDKAKDARECERRILEEKVFTVGDAVSNIEARVCKTRRYIFTGTVVKVVGPMASDQEYEVKWLGCKKDRVNGHVFQYEVKFKCPCCNQARRERYYAPELRKIK